MSYIQIYGMFGRIKIYKIFKWYGGDFKKGTSLVELLNQYTDVEIKANAKVSYMDYDGELNGQ